MLPYEHRSHPVLPTARFLRRMASHAALAGGFLGLSLALGMWGYAHYESMTTTDAFLNAAMILGGMGPVKTEGLVPFPAFTCRRQWAAPLLQRYWTHGFKVPWR